MSEDWCGDCGRAFCSECVVYAFGPKKPPLCRACAIARAGVRKHAARAPVASKRRIRREARERKRDARREPERVSAEQPISAAMDWDAVEAAEAQAPIPSQAPLPPPPVHAVPEPAMAASTSPVMTAPPLTDDLPPAVTGSIIDELPYATDDEPELHEVRPSFESRLTRRRL